MFCAHTDINCFSKDSALEQDVILGPCPDLETVGHGDTRFKSGFD